MSLPLSIKKRQNIHIFQDELLNIAMGAYSRNGKPVYGVNKFGTNLTVGTSFEDIWLQGGTWVKLAAATTLHVSSSSTADTSAGTGARTLYIDGLDANYARVNETVTMNGQTAVTTANTYLFVNRAYIVTGGSGATNAGDIYISDDSVTTTAGVPQTASLIQVKISASQGQTQQAIYTVPAGYTAYMIDAWSVAGNSKVLDFELHKIDNVNSANRILIEGEATNTEFEKHFHPYEAVPEKWTLVFDGKVTAGSAEVSAGFDLILIPD